MAARKPLVQMVSCRIVAIVNPADMRYGKENRWNEWAKSPKGKPVAKNMRMGDVVMFVAGGGRSVSWQFRPITDLMSMRGLSRTAYSEFTVTIDGEWNPDMIQNYAEQAGLVVHTSRGARIPKFEETLHNLYESRLARRRGD